MQRAVLSVSGLWDRMMNSSNISAVLNQCHLRKRLCEALLFGRIAVKKPVWRKQTNDKRFQYVRTYVVVCVVTSICVLEYAYTDIAYIYIYIYIYIYEGCI